MQIKFSKGTKIILIFLVGLLLLLIVLKINQPKEEIIAIPSVTPTPTIKIIDTSPSPKVNQSTTNEIRGEYNFRETIDNEILQAYPLFNYIPFKAEIWSIDYTNKMELTVKLKQDTPEIRQEVFNWITDHGVDPQTHKIIWKTP